MTRQPRLTLDQLRAEEVFIDLTPKQKKLVETYIESNGDRVKAVLSAYETKSEQNARVLAYDVFDSPRVVACLAAFFQSDPLQTFKADVRKAYLNKKLSIAQVQAMRLHADLNGWASTSLPNSRDFGRPAPAVPPSEPKTPSTVPDARVPAGCRPVRSKTTNELLGYLTPDGQRVPLNFFEVVK